jgi:YbbR domain-containing protein
MTRLLMFIVHNWPLKLAAVVLATLLYGVFVITQDSRQIPVNVRIEADNQPRDLVLVSNLGDIRGIRYLAPEDVGEVNEQDFKATVDLSSVTPRTGSVVLGVTVRPIDSRIRVISWEPRQISVTIDRKIARANIPVEVVRDGTVPTGLDVRQPQLDDQAVEVSGASADVDQVDHVEAHVQIEPTGLDIDRQVDLIPVDAQGATLQQVDVEPSSTRVRIAVIENGQTRSVKVAPTITGEPAPGFEIKDVHVDPVVVTIEGDGEQLASITSAETAAISLAGATEDITRIVDLALPTGVLPVGSGQVRVSVTLRPVTGTRTFAAGISLDGTRPDRTYDVSVESVLITIGGSDAELNQLDGRTLTVKASVAGLDPGAHDLPVTVDLPTGLTLLSADPETVRVTIVAPPSPAASPSAGRTPSP